MKIVLVYVSLLFSFSALFTTAQAAQNSDWQKLYKDVPSISKHQLDSRPEDVVLVDVRPKFEYDRSHHNGTKHMSLSSRMFLIQMEDLIRKNKGKTIVVYCDSDNCLKSYRAVEKCQKNDLKNVVLFDLKADMAGSKSEKIYSQL